MLKFELPNVAPSLTDPHCLLSQKYQETFLFQLDGSVFNCYHKYSVLLQPSRNFLDV